MSDNIRIGILTEAETLTASVLRALLPEERFEAGALDLGIDDPGLPRLDVLLVSSGLPPTDVLRLLGRSWTSDPFPRLLFLRGRPAAGADPRAALTRGCARELSERIAAVARGGGAVPLRVTLRFEPGPRLTPVPANGALPRSAAALHGPRPPGRPGG